MMSIMRQKALQAAEGKTDLLLRFFESHFFDEWIALVYLHQNQGPGVHDYLCNKLYDLPEHRLEKYLLQFVYLAVSRPGSALERAIIDICAKSFRIAVKVYWLLLAQTQDQPRNRHLEILKEACERAALDGQWEVPFQNPSLDPLSPTGPAPAWSTDHATRASEKLVIGHSNSKDTDAWGEQPHFLGQGVEEVMCLPQGYHADRPKENGQLSYDLHSLDRSMLIHHPERSSGSYSERYKTLRQQLGDGEGVTALLAKSRESAATGGPGCVSAHYAEDDRSPMADRPQSPTTRLRYDTFGATLDFMQELCDASSTLTSITQEQRQMALHSALESINQAIDSTSKENMAIWFPMGQRRERILRLTANEAVLLNSREKAPFMLFAEVLQEGQETAPAAAPPANYSTPLDGVEGPEISARSWATTRSSSNYADSARSMNDIGEPSAIPNSPSPHDSASTHPPTISPPESPPAPPRAPAPAQRPPPLLIGPNILPSREHSRDFSPKTVTPPTAAPVASGLPPRPRPTPPPSRLLSPRSPFASLAAIPDAIRGSSILPKSSSEASMKLSISGSSTGKESGILKGIAQKSIDFARSLKEHASNSDAPISNERLAELVGSSGTAPQVPQRSQNSIIRRMDDAMASLRGDAPLVKVHICVLDPEVVDPADTAALDADRRRMAAEASTSGSGAKKGVLEEGAAGTFKALHLFSKLSMCRKALLEFEGPPQNKERVVAVRFEVAAGVNLPIPSPYRRSRRVPSQDAIDAIADKYHILTIPPPVDIGPPLKRPPRTPSSLATIPSMPHALSNEPTPLVPEPSTPDPIAPETPFPKPYSTDELHSSAPPSNTSNHDATLSTEASFATAASDTTLPSFSRTNSIPTLDDLPPWPVPSPGAMSPGRDEATTSAMRRKQKEANAVYGERWAEREERIRRESPHGKRKGWALRCAIVKSGDDCRQELLAVQLIRTFHDIFQECGLPLWVRPYEVLVTSNRTALIELIPDCLSIHTVKHRSAPGTSLSDHFFAKFGHGTPECATAQRKFTESMAAYSIICYILQIKDRHNGNIMLDDEGHVVHIDFGFMLSNSPGGVNFESAPFKLTRELLEVMDSTSEGKPSELFDYFKVLCIQGFLAARKHSDRIIQLVRMMSKSTFPCFKTGDRTVKSLEKRFHPNLTEVQCVQVVLGLISESLDAWRTRQYDYYQRVLNGIL